MSTFIPENYRILVIDDHVAILRAVQNVLEADGFRVYTATSGEKALEWITESGLPHLAIVDITMAEMNGFAFCQEVHTYSDLPIIMLTGAQEVQMEIKALDMCAEDYITKPFNKDILLSRVRRLLRRIGDFAYVMQAHVAIDDQFSINFVAHTAVLSGTEIALTPIESKIIYIFLRSPGHPIPASTLIQRLWPMEDADEGRLRVYLFRLRKKMETAVSDDHEYIQSRRGHGYFLQPR